MKIEGGNFLVTGAASGLGLATAKMLVEAGGRVALLDLDETNGQARANELGRDTIFIKTDVRSGTAVENAVAQAEAANGPIRGAVCCAGIAPSEKVLGRERVHALESFTRALEINTIGTFNVIRLAAQAIAKAEPNEEGERGVLVATASVAAYDGQIGQAAYSASKAAVAGMTLPIARELARDGIRMMTIAPGIFETPMMAGFSEEVRSSLGKSVPFPPRLGRPSEYARLVRDIIENPMLNGEVIRLDGALRMAPR
ncbi:NAD(P)-dependent dehydrogenase (short-subunit alcohol dehydrogenase family) [Neorhizobium sp. R1-B]|uniref:3-hydroxyacyl-CoA dehydrogenase n=1 Tax=Neorhizobium TaxID=1525371 RepID=UPI000CF967A8|nr:MULTISPECIES: 3-hydroxyacyl-CoA dehydrogenase [Neorhizobium]TCV74691.1 NAD(P)-dependent dehydrogenase (short-subunit alcohol dehydrogenase family) [Neorhizobium sp. S3-V5DH]TDX69643.1 NAD(P)-dependent dehydrogenase (short-subunit alcohol dehydrogenase family) [Neorhizobium sp. R1-B]